MRVALRFQRHDVDAFLDEIDHEAFEEWSAFVQLEPEGWQADRIAIRRLSWITAQTHAKKQLKESDFDVHLGGNVRSEKEESARWEAFAIRKEIEASMGKQTDG